MRELLHQFRFFFCDGVVHAPPRLALAALLVCASTSTRAAAQGEPPAAARAYTVSGTVYDSLLNEPLIGAFIAVRPAGASTTTDSAGRFSLVSDAPATEITVYHAALDQIGLGALVAQRPDNRGDWTNVQLATPSLAALWPQLCDRGVPRNLRSAILMGTTRLPDNATRLAGARVLVQWKPGPPSSADAPLETLEVVTDSIGNYVACGVEQYVDLTLLGQSREAQSGVIQIPGSMRAIQRVDLVLASLDGSATTTQLRGRVLDGDAKPLAGMTVSIDGREGEVLTGENGGFLLDSVPLGSRMLSVRAVGYTPVSQLVEVLNTTNPVITIPLSKPITLGEVRVTERATLRAQRTEFDRRKRNGIAQFVDSTDIASAPNVRAALQRLLNVRVGPGLGATEFTLFGRNGCAAQLYLDGTLTDLEVIIGLPQQILAAVEAYSSVSLAPAEFIRVKADDCAVVVFWTKWALRP